MMAAQASGDIATILSLVTSTSAMTVTDFIQKTCGSLMFIYYTYVESFHIHPVDIDDLIDGILYLDAHQYAVKQSIAKHNRR